MRLDTSYRLASRWILPTLIAAVLSPLLLVPAEMLERSAPRAALALTLLGLAGLVGGLGAAFVSAVRKPRTGQVAVDARGVSFGADLVPRSSIGAAVVVPTSSEGRPQVRLQRASGSVLGTFEVRDEAQGKEVLEALGLGAAGTVATFRWMSPRASTTTRVSHGLVALGGLLAVAAIVVSQPWLLAAMVASWAAASIVRPVRLEIGADGMRIRGRLEDQFVPWSEIASVEASERGVVARRKGGAPRIDIPLKLGSVTYRTDRDEIRGLVRRMQEAIALHAKGATVSAAARLLRGGRTLEEWRRALFAEREGAFRQNALRDDDLWGVLEDPSAEASARGAAAALLATSADDAGRARIRVAAEACAEQRLRVALDRAAAGASEEELSGALDEIEDTAPREARRAST